MYVGCMEGVGEMEGVCRIHGEGRMHGEGRTHGGSRVHETLQTYQEEKVKFNIHYCYDFVTPLLVNV